MSLGVSQMYLLLVLALQCPFLLVVRLHLGLPDPPKAGRHTQKQRLPLREIVRIYLPLN